MERSAPSMLTPRGATPCRRGRLRGMDEELERYLAALAAEGGTPAAGPDEAAAVLDLARVVAHTAERRFAPASAYLAGLAAAAAAPADRAATIRALRDTARALADEPRGESP
jgi:Domain of unknown function (DUF6457)